MRNVYKEMYFKKIIPTNLRKLIDSIVIYKRCFTGPDPSGSVG